MRQVDALVLEVGLGGRYDATNAVPRGSVVATVVNTLDLEHTDMLGSTIESIAWEKVKGGGGRRRGRWMMTTTVSDSRIRS